MKTPPIVSPQEWDAAREEVLVEEKKLTRARDALAAKRRRMPWMAVEKEYRFDGPEGPVSLLDLFEGRRQLIVYRAFYAPHTHKGAVPTRNVPAWAAHSSPTKSRTPPTSTRGIRPSPSFRALPRPKSRA
jgi:predicted dithiol-disulfide oxidoreductase (DUF899 family)